MTALPNRSGRESASTPGRPWNASTLESSGKVTGPRSERGRVKGDMASRPVANSSLYSKVTRPFSSSATAPTSRSQSQTSATTASGMAGSRRAPALFSLQLEQLHRREPRIREDGVPRFEAVQRPEELDQRRSEACRVEK